VPCHGIEERVDEIKSLLSSDLPDDCHESIERMRGVWSVRYASYFDTHVSPKIFQTGLWKIRQNSIRLNGITTNSAEAMNAMIKYE
jgi:hypothetical protein